MDNGTSAACGTGESHLHHKILSGAVSEPSEGDDGPERGGAVQVQRATSEQAWGIRPEGRRARLMQGSGITLCGLWPGT